MNKRKKTNKPFHLEQWNAKGVFIPVGPLVFVNSKLPLIDSFIDFDRWEGGGDLFKYTHSNYKMLDTLIHELIHFYHIFSTTAGLVFLLIQELQIGVTGQLYKCLEHLIGTHDCENNIWPGLLAIADKNTDDQVLAHRNDWLQLERLNNVLFGREQCRVSDAIISLHYLLAMSDFSKKDEVNPRVINVIRNSATMLNKSALLAKEYLDSDSRFKAVHPDYNWPNIVFLNTNILFENYARFLETFHHSYHRTKYGKFLSKQENKYYFWKEKYGSRYFVTINEAMLILQNLLKLPKVDPYTSQEININFSAEQQNHIFFTIMIAHEISLMTPLFPTSAIHWPDSISWIDLHPVQRYFKVLKCWRDKAIPIPEPDDLFSNEDAMRCYMDSVCKVLKWPSYSHTIDAILSLKANTESKIFNNYINLAKLFFEIKLKRPVETYFDPIFEFMLIKKAFPIIAFKDGISINIPSNTSKIVYEPFYIKVTGFAKSNFLRFAATGAKIEDVKERIMKFKQVPGLVYFWQVVNNIFQKIPFSLE